MANGKFGIGQRDSTVDVAKQNDAIVAISGDYYAARREGLLSVMASYIVMSYFRMY